MKDIDFDELDRAVNSLISPGEGSSAAPAAVPAATPQVSPVASTATTIPPLAERRSSGRFMDVVHPSSDMRSVTVPPRTTTAIADPVAPSISEPAAPTAAWPDPIDMHESATKQEAPTASTLNSVAEPVSDAQAPQESPFLSDAKVEKRPLGAFSNEVHESGPSDPAVVPKPVDQPEVFTPAPAAQDTPKAPDSQIHNDTPLPAELQPGLLSIEANEDPSKVTLSTAIPTATESTGPTSITQQYTEQPSTGDKPTGTVFDTEAYKKPQPSKKKKSGWLVVLWIFLLLVVGAGIGAAVYFFVLPRL